jgi:hypothetical protein
MLAINVSKAGNLITMTTQVPGQSYSPIQQLLHLT